MRLSMTIEDDDLDEQEIAFLKEFLAQADFFHLPPRIEAHNAVDTFTYRIDVHWQNQEHTVEVDDAAAPEKLCPLIEHLEQLMRTRRRPA